RTLPSFTSVATLNLPSSLTGRIAQRIIWLKNLSYSSLASQEPDQRLPASDVKATVFPAPYRQPARIVPFSASMSCARISTSTSGFSFFDVSTKPVTGLGGERPTSISCDESSTTIGKPFESSLINGRATLRASI